MKSSPVGRPRSAGRRDLPDNLIPHRRKTTAGDVTYWYWRDPRDGVQKSLRCPNDRATAIKRARELNAIVSKEMATRVVEEIALSPHKRAASGTPFNAFAVHCLAQFETRGFALNTLRTRKSLINAAIRWFEDKPMHEIGVPDMAQLIKSYTDRGKNRYAQALRAALIDVWKEAYQEGLLPADHPNPAEIARRPTAKVNRARLTLDAFNIILGSSKVLAERRGVWMPNSMLLALVTGQRREDLVIAQFRKGKDWQAAWEAYQEGRKHKIHPYPYIEDGFFWVIQQKTGALVKIPLSLRLEALDISVGDVIEQCRSPIASRYLLHHTQPFGNAPRGSRISIDKVSHAFADARDATDLTWPGRTPPTYHEIRSLAERLYKAQGVDTQALLGHRHARMTEVYADPRQAEWTTVVR